jgi:hypothetical protein
VLSWAHRVFANLKRWALGVYHGLRQKHLQSYLDEFIFRSNRLRPDRGGDPGWSAQSLSATR